MTISQEILEVFKRHDYRWMIDGKLKTPSEQDISDVIESAKEYIREDGGSIEIGRLIIRKDIPEIETYDVYVLIGEIND